MFQNQWENQIQNSSKKWGMDPNLVKAIITQESNWDCYTIRYEVNYRYLYKPEEFCKKINVSLSTEMNTQKMSWGLGQLMGALTRELGFEQQFPVLTNPIINIDLMCKHLQNLKKISHLQNDIIAMYNGGEGALQKINGVYTNQGYVTSVNNHLKNLTH